MVHILTVIFTVVDDFIREVLSSPMPLNQKSFFKTHESAQMSLSEMMTILIAFHNSPFRNFKQFYVHLLEHYQTEFPQLVSYPRFVALQEKCVLPLIAFFQFAKGAETPIKYVDASPLPVCHNKREFSHRVFKGFAKKGKSTMGWFFGFKIHLVINEKRQPIAFCVTPGNVDERTVMGKLTKNLTGKIYGDRGYIKQELFEELFSKGIQLITMLRSNMHPKIMPLDDRLNLKKRCQIEGVFHIAKNIKHLSHTRHRSLIGFMVNVLACVCSLCQSEKRRLAMTTG